MPLVFLIGHSLLDASAEAICDFGQVTGLTVNSTALNIEEEYSARRPPNNVYLE